MSHSQAVHKIVDETGWKFDLQLENEVVERDPTLSGYKQFEISRRGITLTISRNGRVALRVSTNTASDNRLLEISPKLLAELRVLMETDWPAKIQDAYLQGYEAGLGRPIREG